MLTRFSVGQEQNAELKEFAPQISKLIRLKMDGQEIRLDREHWERVAEKKTEEERLNEEIEKLVERGILREHAKQHVESKRRFGHNNETTLGILFSNFQEATGCRSGGSGGGGSSREWHGRSNALLVRMHQMPDTFGLTFRQTTEPFQELIVSSHKISGLRIQVNSDTGLMLFWQKYDDSIRFVYSSGDRNEAISVKNHDEFLTKHPDLAKEFWEQLIELGIQKPLQKDDPGILTAIEAILLKPESTPVEAADEEILLLGDSNYKIRKAARQKIEANYDAWSKRIRKALKTPDLDAETRIALEGIVASAKENAEAPESEIECFIREHKLMADREYLASIVDSASDEAKPLIRKRIAELE